MPSAADSHDRFQVVLVFEFGMYTETTVEIRRIPRILPSKIDLANGFVWKCISNGENAVEADYSRDMETPAFASAQLESSRPRKARSWRDSLINPRSSRPQMFRPPSDIARYSFGRDAMNLPTTLLIAFSYFQPDPAGNSYRGSAVVTMIMSRSCNKMM